MTHCRCPSRFLALTQTLTDSFSLRAPSHKAYVYTPGRADYTGPMSRVELMTGSMSGMLEQAPVTAQTIGQRAVAFAFAAAAMFSVALGGPGVVSPRAESIAVAEGEVVADIPEPRQPQRGEQVPDGVNQIKRNQYAKQKTRPRQGYKRTGH
jgi:hypothetical protein